MDDPTNANVQYMKQMFENQRETFEHTVSKVLDGRLQAVIQQISGNFYAAIGELKNEMHEMRTKTTALEEAVRKCVYELGSTKRAVTELDSRLSEATKRLEEKTEQLEIDARRNNLKLFNVPRLASRETNEDCVKAVLEVLQGTVPGKNWALADIAQARRLGRYDDDFGRPPPMIVKFARLDDKMAVLTRGKAELQRRKVTVSGDLTDRQRETVQEYRRQGLHAYYRGDRLVVEEQVLSALASAGVGLTTTDQGTPDKTDTDTQTVQPDSDQKKAMNTQQAPRTRNRSAHTGSTARLRSASCASASSKRQTTMDETVNKSKKASKE